MTEGCKGRGPYVCAYPDYRAANIGDRWTCPECGARYRLSRQGEDHGYWRWTLWSRLTWRSA